METFYGENTIWTSDPKIEIKKHFDDIKPTTITQILNETCEKFHNNIVFRYSENNTNIEKTWGEFYEDVVKFSRSLIFKGLEEYQSVMIQGFNSYEWAVSHFASIMAGGLSVGVYTTNSPDVCKYMVRDCNTQFVIVENLKQLNKYRENLEELNTIKCFVIWKEYDRLDEFWQNSSVPVYKWSSFLNINNNSVLKSSLDFELTKRSKNITPWRCSSLIYTSGTTGYPKGVMMSHDNICWTAQIIMRDFEFSEYDRIVSYLPLSHIAAQALDFYVPLFSGAQVTFATPDVLKGRLVETLTSVRPTLFFGVPRVWEKIYEAMVSKGKNNGCIKSSIVRWAKSIGINNVRLSENNEGRPFFFGLANNMVFKKVKKALGLSKCRYFMTGAAPISDKILDFFSSLNIPIMNLYGLSETSGPMTFNLPTAFKMYMDVPNYDQKRISCGKPFRGETVDLCNVDDSGNGEIICKGRHIFMGYINKSEATSKVFDKNGFFYSGDIGYMDNEGYLTITGRSKEIIITKGGENVAPVLIENNIKKELPNLVSNVVVIGDDKKYLTCLITLRCIQNDDGSFEKKLIDDLQNLLQKDENIQNIQKCMVINQMVSSGIARANKLAISNAQTVKKYRIILGDFSILGGELTPTMKLKRNVINKKYKDFINLMYSN